MRTLKRILVLLAELLTEALFLGVMLGTIATASAGAHDWKAVLGAVIAVPVILALHGYYISRILVTILSFSRVKWLYPIGAAAAFAAHVAYMQVRFSQDFDAEFKPFLLRFLIAGTCVVFVCALGGTQLFRTWSQVRVDPRSINGAGAPA
jgi:hypothetical protein